MSQITMPYLQRLLVGLMLFSPAIYALATPEQVARGKVKGFTGPADVELTGDYLTATFCYCEYPPRIEEYIGLTHYYQFEYYNTHLDTTFILNSTCPQDYVGYDFGCVPPARGQHVLAGYTMDEKCRTWHGEHDDKFCYQAWSSQGDDYIYFNDQKRGLGQMGSQGPVWKHKMEAEKVCEGMCRESMDAELFRDDDYLPSHQVVWTDLDDMCDHCR